MASDQAARVLQNAVTMSILKRFDRFSSFWPPRTQNFAETVTPRLLAVGGGTGDKTGRPAPDRENRSSVNCNGKNSQIFAPPLTRGGVLTPREVQLHST